MTSTDSRLISLIKFIKMLRINFFKRLFLLFPIKSNKIIIWSNSFKAYTCNPKYLTEYLVSHKPEKYDIVWVLNHGIEIPTEMPLSVRIIRYYSIGFLYEIATSRFIICNFRTSESVLYHKRKKQIYIQTWHSSLRLKKIEKDAIESLNENYINRAKWDSTKIDIIISGCEFSTKIFRDSFWYNGKILNTGTPRIDYLLNENSKAATKVKKYFNLDERVNLVIYAPTFRDNNNIDVFNLDTEGVISTLKMKFGGDWKLLIRLHPNISELSATLTCNKECIDATNYNDMQELLSASSVLITDYSSSMFDFAYMKRLCILYMPDYSDYTQKERGLYFDIKQLPFPNALTNAEVFKTILDFDNIRYNSDIMEFFKLVGSYENGEACQLIEEKIDEIMNQEVHKG